MYMMLERQRTWGWLAYGNFLLGGMGGGLYAAAYALNILDSTISIASLMLVVGGLLCVGAEAGNPLKAYNVMRNIRTSWMSREAVAASGFALFTLLDLVSPNLVLRFLAWACSLAYLVSQSFMPAAAKKIPAWNTPATPPLFMALSILAGLGILNVLYEPTQLLRLTTAASSLITIVLAASYITWPGATLHFKRALTAEWNIAYLAAAVAVTALGLTAPMPWTHPYAVAAALLLGTSLAKYTITIRMSYKLPVMPPVDFGGV